MKKPALVLLALIAVPHGAAASGVSGRWDELITKLEMTKNSVSLASLDVSRPSPSIQAETGPAPCSSRDPYGRCDSFDFTIGAVLAYQAEDVKRYHRASLEAIAKSNDGVSHAIELVLAASRNAQFSAQERSALKDLHSSLLSRHLKEYPALFSLAKSHEQVLKSIAGTSGYLKMEDSKYKELSDRTSDTLGADGQMIDEIIAKVCGLGGVEGPDGRYDTDLGALDLPDVYAVLVFRDVQGHEKEVEELATNAGLLTRKTYIMPGFNPRKAVYLKNGLPAELEKQWFQGDENVVAVSLGKGTGSSRPVIKRYTLEEFQWTYQGAKQPDNIKMELAFLKAGD